MSISTFARLGVPDHFVRVLDERGITEPFPIQAAAIPDALAGRDVLGRAPTGSGKTLAFGLPLLANLERAASKAPRALVLAPTRELAEQIRRELQPLAAAAGRQVASVYGGVSYNPQRARLRRGVDVLVATPGRLADLVEQGDVRLGQVDRVVVDEADRMSDMGFLPQVRRLLDLTSRDRQTLLFSATLDGDVAVLTRTYQQDPVRHDAGGADQQPSDARHFFWRVDREQRVSHTAELIAASRPTVVFTRTRHGADRLARQLERTGVSAAAIHGGRSQNQRDRALKAFAEGRVDALIATDVAARGIHVDGVASVVHFDPPDGFKTYLHRSGRTARAGASGVVVSLVVADEVAAVRSIQRDLGLEGRLDAPAANGSTNGGGVVLGAEAGRAPSAERPARDGSARNGSGRNGSTRNGSARNGSARNGSARNGSGRNGSGRNGSGNGGRRRNRSGNRDRSQAPTGRRRSA